MTIESAYYQWQGKPQLVHRWERVACEADEPEAGTTQLIYELLVQTRKIKLILLWTLIPPAALFGLSMIIMLIVGMAGSLT